MKNKVTTAKEAIKQIKNGDTVMIGGFLGNGSPSKLIDELLDSEIKDLTLICSDTAFEDVDHGKLIKNRKVKKLYASHIGTNKETGRQMNDGSLIVELVPQGTLVERIRCGGYGLGGILTPTGVGTKVAEGKQILEIDEKEYLVETALQADFALIEADTSDETGNLLYKGSAMNFNHVMASGAKTTIVQVRNIIGSSEMDPNRVQTPNVFVDYIVEGSE